jgi:hypothetical protein
MSVIDDLQNIINGEPVEPEIKTVEDLREALKNK